MIEIPAGPATLGRECDGRLRLGQRISRATRWTCRPFPCREHKVTNGEYLEFVRQGAAPPFFWREHDGRWFYRGMFSESPLPLDCPVYVTQRRGGGLCAMARQATDHRARISPRRQRWRRRPPTAISTSATGIPSAGDAAGAAISTATAGSGPPPSSRPSPASSRFRFITNYSEPFFDGQHYVLKGASPRTAACFLRPSFRNWFRPSYPYIYATSVW